MKQATLNIGRTILAWLSYTMTKSVPASQSLFPLWHSELVGSAVGAMPPYGGRFPTACLRTVLTRLHVYGSPPITAF